MANGLVVREHKASGKRPWNCLPFNHIKLILKFLVNYAEENAILLPGRVPGHKNSEVQLLPSSTTKMVKTFNLNYYSVIANDMHTFHRWCGNNTALRVLRQVFELLPELHSCDTGVNWLHIFLS